MSAVLPLACWPWPVPPVVVDVVKAAKALVAERNHLDFQLQLVEALPGTPLRILSFKGPAPFAGTVSKLRNWQDVEEVAFWLEWILDPMQPDGVGFTTADWIAMHFPGATELPPEVVLPARSLEEAVYGDLPY
ncbi:hypothetical protein [Pseudolysinimonas sp.]|uniref:hypothetical protein n=1 Tax=Pseudolysinimonas sp. TaxID=2680009 RepID=UPI003F81CED4